MRQHRHRMSDAEITNMMTALDERRAKLVRIEEAAAMCGRKRTTFWRWRRDNPDFPVSLRNGRGHILFERAAIEAWLVEHGRAPSPSDCK
jgi:predicted DNA-binding transcriptional regulator AlpA